MTDFDANNAAAVAQLAERIAANSALQYLRTHSLHADPKALAECVRSWIKIKLPEALNDAFDALSIPGMGKVAEATFAASMAQAGVEAAKEAGFHKEEAKS